VKFRESQNPAPYSRRNQVVHLGVHVLDAHVGQHDPESSLKGVALRLASTSTATLFTGANVSATGHAKN
jgi:hypothetical protein